MGTSESSLKDNLTLPDGKKSHQRNGFQGSNQEPSSISFNSTNPNFLGVYPQTHSLGIASQNEGTYFDARDPRGKRNVYPEQDEYLLPGKSSPGGENPSLTPRANSLTNHRSDKDVRSFLYCMFFFPI